MTAVFAAGIATIMLPIALGIVAVAQTTIANHGLIFVAGGFLMIILGFWTLSGYGMLPRFNLPARLDKTDVPSVYTLGVFSGAATSCCAPVLAGVIVLSALSASLLEALVIGATYVAGMTFPLLVVALVWNKFSATGENPLSGRMLNFTFLGVGISIHSSKLIAGSMFTIMGAITVILGLTGTMIPTPGSEIVAVLQAQLENRAVGSFSAVTAEQMALPLGMLILALAGGLIIRRRLNSRQLRSPSADSPV
jgi:hypothetical protein